MGYRSALLLAWFTGSACAQMAEVAVYLDSDRPVAAKVSESMQQEAGSIVGRSGVRLIWTAKPDTKPYQRIAVVSLRGSCGVGTLSNASRISEPLGDTQISNGRVLPFADVACDAVHRLIDRDLRGARPADRERLLGRALGRVMAHELYHVLSESTRHGQTGVTRAALSSSDLLSDR